MYVMFVKRNILNLRWEVCDVLKCINKVFTDTHTPMRVYVEPVYLGYDREHAVVYYNKLYLSWQ